MGDIPETTRAKLSMSLDDLRASRPKEESGTQKRRNQKPGREQKIHRTGKQGQFQRNQRREQDNYNHRQQNDFRPNQRSNERKESRPSVFDRLGGKSNSRASRPGGDNAFNKRRNAVEKNHSRSIASRLRAEWNDDHTQVSFYLLPKYTKRGEQPEANSTSLLVMPDSGKFVVLCHGEERNTETAQAVNTILRPFNIRVAPATPRDYSTEWYLSNGKDFRVKCSDEAVGGSFTMDISKRFRLISMLLEADSLFIDITPTPQSTGPQVGGPMRRGRIGAKRHAPYGAASNAHGQHPVEKLYNICKSQGWAPPTFACEEYPAAEGSTHFGWKVSLPKFGMELPVKEELKHGNRTVAKNLAAENAIQIVSSFKGM